MVECKFVLYADKLLKDDIHFVKEKQGDTINFRIIKDYQRPYWVTLPHYRNHQQKKETEELSKLAEKTTTQKDLIQSVATTLGLPKSNINRKLVPESPYVYGLDIDSKVIIKHEYGNVLTENKIATLDLEVDIDTDIVAIGTVTYNSGEHYEVYTVVNKQYLKPDTNLDILKLPEIEKKYNYSYKVVETELDIVKSILEKLHEWKPDITAIWNMDYDIPKLINVLQKNNLDPKDYFSDPNIPEKYRYFKYEQSSEFMVTESGVRKLIKPEERWHIVYTPSTWIWIDAMSAHRYVRVGGKTMPGGYSLNNILEKELGSEFKKLEFSHLPEGIKGAQWHRTMLKEYPYEYICYNIWDALSMQELDRKTKDLAMTISILSGDSPLEIFNSGPKKIINVLHYFCLKHDRVLGSRPPEFKELDTLGLDQWISILDSDKLIKEYNVNVKDHNLKNNIRGNVFDLDAVSSYPSDTLAANVSKDTTTTELTAIQGKYKEDFIIHNLNLFFGSVNSMEYCKYMFNLPTIEDLQNIDLERYK